MADTARFPTAAKFPASPPKTSFSPTNAPPSWSSPIRTPSTLSSDDPATPQKLEQARKIFAALQHGAIDRALFTDNANFYFNAQALQDFAASLGPLGTPDEFTQTRQTLRGGMIMRMYRVKFPKQELQAWTYELPTGQLEQFQVAPQD
jgi:hypothetical protein